MDEAQLGVLVDRAFDFLCERRVGELVHVDDVLVGIERAATRDRVERIVERFVRPARKRVLAAFRRGGRKLGAWLPEATREALARALGEPVVLPPDLIDEVVNAEWVRAAVRDMLQESITGMFGPAGRGPLGFGLKLGERLGAFLNVGVGIVQRGIADRLESPSTARAMGKRRRKLFLGLLGRTEADAVRWIDRVPHALIEALAPEVIAHNLERAEIRAVLRREVEAALEELSQQTIGELLDEYGLREHVREVGRRRAAPLLGELLARLGAG